MAPAFGIDIGGSSIKLAVLEPESGVLFRAMSQEYVDPGRRTLAATIADLVASAPSGTEGASIGVSLPGQFEPDGRTVRFSANLPALNGLSIDDLVTDALGQGPLPLVVLPDAVASALGTHHIDQAEGRLLVLALGTGVGAALLVNGFPVTLGGPGCGHFGQMDVSLGTDAPLGPDGGRGSLEAYLGAPALRARLGSDLASAVGAVPDDDTALLALSRAIRIAHAIYTPDAIRLVGGVGIALRPKLDAIRRLVDRDLTGVANPGWSLSCADDPYLAAIGVAASASRAPGPS